MQNKFFQFPGDEEDADYAIELPSKGSLRNNRIRVNLKHKKRKEQREFYRENREETWQ
jgi:hypothetical protein